MEPISKQNKPETMTFAAASGTIIPKPFQQKLDTIFCLYFLHIIFCMCLPGNFNAKRTMEPMRPPPGMQQAALEF